MAEVIGIQLIRNSHVQYCLSAGKKYQPETYCVVETEHGIQMGRVVSTNREMPECRVSGSLRRVLRPATARDFEQRKTNEKREREADKLCREKVLHKGLNMKLVDVNYTLDGRKAIFFFTAENRVDFRELVKELAQALKVKIEMRQIGVRDEARRLGGVGCCGQPLCCCSFLSDFVSVSIRMAKDQNLSLNPTKVSGLCGRLMCCLAYEYEGSIKSAKKKGKEKPAPAVGKEKIPWEETDSLMAGEELPSLLNQEKAAPDFAQTMSASAQDAEPKPPGSTALQESPPVKAEIASASQRHGRKRRNRKRRFRHRNQATEPRLPK